MKKIVELLTQEKMKVVAIVLLLLFSYLFFSPEKFFFFILLLIITFEFLLVLNFPELSTKEGSFSKVIVFSLGCLFIFYFISFGKFEAFGAWISRLDVLVQGKDLIIKLNSQSDELQNKIEKISNLSKILELELRARTGEKEAFMDLKEISKIATHPYSIQAKRISSSIELAFGSYVFSLNKPVPIIKWKEWGLSEERIASYSMTELKYLFYNPPKEVVSEYWFKMGFLNYVYYNRPDIPIELKIAWAREIVLSNENLYSIYDSQAFLSRHYGFHQISSEFQGFLKDLDEFLRPKASPASMPTSIASDTK